ncbi:hypothetical protein CFE70_000173 [Pyrenophora teres f. teres 0-1]|uniref:Uncharacterized protein n=2 Tax=Pyrenophora teres f. teres TaxID=97479 RepID=E3RCQ8_PYRTT|nr:hypothetical protein PTT_00797 [Pyrenophora teres f. teres 0-1]KAE8836574.1 hypothetical protein HRS9139_04672 [Pyrenophora teres f. teres]KAE8837454.1 hypothetical protein PTNB85_04789 [Pyrenophora teres f. teres]KAE8840124.1 hypothetical protein HRS9122_06729 [Pyrenophora teres f. teres]KAE8862280.1 hypothetical protein PTNB29_04842 [Pyrenophora teres f. teres]
MRLIALAASLPVAFAFWNNDLCNGWGGCIGIGNLVRDPFRCPDGTSINLPDFSNDQDLAGKENAPRITKEEFPSTCFEGAVPGPDDKLVRTKTRNGQTIYSFVHETCPSGRVEKRGDCYHFNPNPATYKFCQLIDAKGGQCTTNPNAGKCERWGDDIRPECSYWKMGLPDLPRDD